MKIIVILLLFISDYAFSKEVIDTLQKKSKIYFGVDQKNLLVTPFTNSNYLNENTISSFFKKNDYCFSLGAGVISNIEDGNGNRNKMFGGQASVSIDFYDYKKILYVPITITISYYRHNYHYNILNALISAGNINAKMGIEYVVLKQLHLYINGGINISYFSDSYTEQNGKRHTRSLTGGYPYVFDTGIKYFLKKK
jgi:hypothetical protein